MKIGIITHHYVNNFGAFLQAYALQGEIGRLMPEADVRVIDLKNRRHALINTLGLFRLRKRPYGPREAFDRMRLARTFARARRERLCLTARVHTAAQVNRLRFDAIIVGSDEVWNYADKKSVMAAKYGVGLACGNLIAYAPSAGQAPREARIPEVLARGLRRFDHLSARDELTRRMLAGLGRRAEMTLDPTFLCPPKGKHVDVPRPYVLFYACERLPREAKEALRIDAARRGAALIGAGEGGAFYDRRMICLTPFEWAGLFEGADGVVTGSLHGAVFSILNRRRFVCWPGNRSRGQKLQALLGEMGLEGRMLTRPGEAAEVLRREIDYDRVTEKIEQRRRRSEAYLLESLEGKA